jgi:hypothetical protein
LEGTISEQKDGGCPGGAYCERRQAQERLRQGHKEVKRENLAKVWAQRCRGLPCDP